VAVEVVVEVVEETAAAVVVVLGWEEVVEVLAVEVTAAH